MRTIRDAAKKIPRVRDFGRVLRTVLASHERIFTNIYRKNRFGGEVSVSGPGSDLVQTRTIIRELPTLLREFEVSAILDIPCGDCLWIGNADLRGVSYIGADVVKELVEQNGKRFAHKNMRFLRLNLVRDRLPQTDLILCRDCLVHLCFRDIFRALTNVCRSGSPYLLTTTFVSRKENYDISTGQWRPLNLETAPFCLPRPLRTINEECTEGDGMYNDKSLGLWRVEDIRNRLEDRYA
jgi:hypothetical protein